MQMFIKKQIGKQTYTFVFEGKNLHEVVMESQKLSFPDKIEKCGNCGGDDLYLNARLAGEKGKYKYTEIRCRNPKCGAQLQFGVPTQDENTTYLRKIEHEGKKVFEWKLIPKNENNINE